MVKKFLSVLFVFFFVVFVDASSSINVVSFANVIVVLFVCVFVYFVFKNVVDSVIVNGIVVLFNSDMFVIDVY